MEAALAADFAKAGCGGPHEQNRVTCIQLRGSENMAGHSRTIPLT